MSDKKRDVRSEPWAKNAPDYMVEAIAILVDTRDEVREMLAHLNAREATVAGREQIIRDRETSFVQAAEDMKSFANQLYGPDSELTQIKLRLDELPRVDEVTRRLTEHGQRLVEHGTSLDDLRSRVTSLEQRKTA